MGINKWRWKIHFVWLDMRFSALSMKTRVSLLTPQSRAGLTFQSSIPPPTSGMISEARKWQGPGCKLKCAQNNIFTINIS
jgi:hypothetical protein